MRRAARRKIIRLSPQQMAELKRQQRLILHEERAELTVRANEFRHKHELGHIVQLLKEERKAQGLSLADMQKKTGISRAALSRLENTKDANPTIGTLDRLANAVGKRLMVGLH